MNVLQMYEGGKLLFCDHIFNGYGNAKKDFHKQMMITRRSANAGSHLPKDFRFRSVAMSQYVYMICEQDYQYIHVYVYCLISCN